MRRRLKLVLPWLLLFSSGLIDANPVVIHFMNELQLDSSGWVLELTNHGRKFGFTERLSLDGCYLISSTDTSYFRNGMSLDSTYLTITEDSLQTFFRINPAGDVLRFFFADHSEFDQLRFGDSCIAAYRCPPAPAQGQSISLIDNCYYLDNTPTLGQPNDTLNAMGSVCGTVRDAWGNPLPGATIWAEPLYVSDYYRFGRQARTDDQGEYCLTILSAWVGIYHHKEDYQSKELYVQVYPDTTITAEVSLDFVQSIKANSTSSLLDGYALHFNYPNPFNQATTFAYHIPIDDYLEIDIYNLEGQRVENLYSGFQQTGHYALSWNAQHAPSGIYIYRLKSANQTLSRKCLLIK
ncbi:T9SS type A sorting domain-containing protein [bacterium]|nr:T9SS type A sorting domain-containing protein [bacterium]